MDPKLTEHVTKDDQGKVVEHMFFDPEGRLDSRYVAYGPNGKPVRESMYRAGQLHGDVVFYSPEGERARRADAAL
jgi:antitoxin component YwqK of YwqJK toxin-antitoxin module